MQNFLTPISQLEDCTQGKSLLCKADLKVTFPIQNFLSLRRVACRNILGSQDFAILLMHSFCGEQSDLLSIEFLSKGEHLVVLRVLILLLLKLDSVLLGVQGDHI